jgi:methionine-rich copper-binding protein CopC
MKRLTTLLRYYGHLSLVALMSALLVSVSLLAVTAAHALLVNSEPESGAMLAQSPRKVIAWYSEELETDLSSLRVFDGEGGQVDNGDGSVDLNDPDHASMIVTMPAALTAGAYTVRWTAVSADDGDETDGEFAFKVAGSEAVSGQVSAAQPLPEPTNEPDRPLTWIAAGFMILLLVVVGATIYNRWRKSN